ncbi:cuticular protein RR-3 motif 147 [Aphomia sociella]
MEVFKILFVVIFPWMCESRVLSAPRQARHSLAESMPSYYFTNIDGHPGTYSFGYDTYDEATGNTQYRTEERYPNGTVVGSYGYVDPRGRARRFTYIADEKGYRLISSVPKTTTVQAIKLSDSISTEASITWTRPKKNKNKVGSNYLVKLPIQRNDNHLNR